MAVIDPHYVWALGHGLMLFGSIYILLQTVLFRGTPSFVYRLSYTGALLSYSIVVYKSLGIPQLNAAWARRAFVDENVQYAVLAMYWWISKPINISILPFATFSLFHCLTFIRTNILPKFVAAPPPQAAGATPGQQRQLTALENVSRQIQLWVKNNYDTAMRFVAFAELLILARVTLGAITFRSSAIAPLFLAHFIRLRYHASPFTKQAVGVAGAKIDSYIGENQIWIKIKSYIAAWSGHGAVPAPPAQGGAARR
ncbi:transmembrane protein 33, partial [Tremellales sp. Uapishka_1]